MCVAQRAGDRLVAAASGQRLDPVNWYPGQPLLVTANDHEARIYNGDTGVVVDGRRLAARRTATRQRADPGAPHTVGCGATVFAMTIHRSQGSQYDTVSVVLPQSLVIADQGTALHRHHPRTKARSRYRYGGVGAGRCRASGCRGPAACAARCCCPDSSACSCRCGSAWFVGTVVRRPPRTSTTERTTSTWRSSSTSTAGRRPRWLTSPRSRGRSRWLRGLPG